MFFTAVADISKLFFLLIYFIQLFLKNTVQVREKNKRLPQSIGITAFLIIEESLLNLKSKRSYSMCREVS